MSRNYGPLSRAYLYQVEGFEEVSRLIKKLPDKVKKAEMLKILGQVANPSMVTARGLAPKSDKPHKSRGHTIQPGNLKKSIGKITGKRGLGKENAVLYVGAKVKKGKWGYGDGWYAHLVEYGHNIYNNKGSVVRKGKTKGRLKHTLARISHKTQGNVTGRVEGSNFFQTAYDMTRGRMTLDAELKMAKYIQKQITRLSN